MQLARHLGNCQQHDVVNFIAVYFEKVQGVTFLCLLRHPFEYVLVMIRFSSVYMKA